MNPTFTSVSSNPEEKSHFFPQGIPRKKSFRKTEATPSSIQTDAPKRDEPLHAVFQNKNLMDYLESEIDLASQHEMHTLLVGETGTGKEVVARAIHEKRLQRLALETENPFVALNCAAIPEGLAESILFGHERGAFTSARDRQCGKFEQAQRGVLFLDEIQNLSLSIQAKLLRVLQSGELDRLGSKKPIQIECKIIAATNIPLDLLVEKGLFRRDLFYRICVVPILLPPLRQRKTEIPDLALRLLQKLCEKYKLSNFSLGESFLAALQDYDWPGNIRELEHALLYAALRKKAVVSIEDLPPTVRGDQKDFIENGRWDSSALNKRNVLH